MSKHGTDAQDFIAARPLGGGATKVAAAAAESLSDVELVKWAYATGRVDARGADKARIMMFFDKKRAETRAELLAAEGDRHPTTGSYLDLSEQAVIERLGEYKKQNDEAAREARQRAEIAASRAATQAAVAAASASRAPVRLSAVAATQGLPPVMASGIDPSVLLRVPQVAWNGLAHNPNRAEVAQAILELTSLPAGSAELTDTALIYASNEDATAHHHAADAAARAADEAAVDNDPEFKAFVQGLSEWDGR
ncbi:hypothetical protein [Motilibacter peucedani]|uniref:hypothetical protein n=1 Tax=Motilibacter peucedani TaxID=598650 RepID=UPI000EAC4BCF|nr:hypothetical protein [Motilibacter peucedani]